MAQTWMWIRNVITIRNEHKINSVVMALWRRCYKIVDIDTILFNRIEKREKLIGSFEKNATKRRQDEYLSWFFIREESQEGYF